MIGRREQRAGDHLPYARMLDAHTVQLRDGALLQCLHLGGLAFETADSEELDYRQQARDAALRAIADSRFVLHHHVVRRRASADLDAAHDDPVCGLIDQRWRQRPGAQRLFVNELFLSVLRRPSRGKAGLAERLARGLRRGLGSQSQQQLLERDLRDLEAARDALLAALQPYGARLLGDYDSAHGVCSEPLELLSALYNGELRPLLKPIGDAGHYLPYRRISFGLEAIERSGPGPARDFAALLSLKEYPAQAMPGMFDALLRLPHELVLAESFGFVERQLGLERLSLALRRQRAADEDSASLRQGLIEAKDDLASGRSVFGEHRLQLQVRAPSLDALDAAVAECASALADLGAVVVREDLALEPAFWAQFPGNEAYAARSALVSSAAFAGLASLHGFPLGQASGNHWGDAVTVLESTAATPYFFNFHRGDLGNFTVIGPSGSGKTVVLNFLAAQAQKWRPRLLLFDKDRGAEIFIRAIGGRYAGLRTGMATGFNPLQLPDNAGNRAFLRQWIARLLCAPGQRLDADEEAIVAAAVDANYDQAVEFRRLRWFAELLAGRRRPQPGDLAARLAPWHGDGEHAWLFDHAQDQLDLSLPVLGFDMTELLDAPVLRTPAMMYLFHRVEERLDGTPAMIVIDEGWKALDDEVFAAHIRDWMKTLRKRNAILGFGTQSARDALDSRVSSAIIEQAATQLFMPNPRARADDYCEGFGLTPQELELVRTLPAGSHCFLVKHGHDSVIARLDLSAMPELLTVLSGRESSVRRLDQLRAEVGDAPTQWWPALTGVPYPQPRAAGAVA
ncbi:VirB4 family type IV secretion/conjugal transfer ATPase [Pseudoxanthomonas sp.]|uniref:VirB4 family type IV secretion/conjugal transfer ATPase n=1 Tax=Pseudoxanthomonas sp. TaxID=1871049 RepID=UPI00263642EE|nr:VirB4 family type IV secretion/conjugal transfer ATPase [Pseudoxanthomonas sp.]WDS35481.1 MAG: VirB4 family type IV secretion/conjugal transfer ATPase [Pseudoxanthomonas sp.]